MDGFVWSRLAPCSGTSSGETTFPQSTSPSFQKEKPDPSVILILSKDEDLLSKGIIRHPLLRELILSANFEPAIELTRTLFFLIQWPGRGLHGVFHCTCSQRHPRSPWQKQSRTVLLVCMSGEWKAALFSLYDLLSSSLMPQATRR